MNQQPPEQHVPGQPIGLETILSAGDPDAFRAYCEASHPAAIAEGLGSLEAESIRTWLGHLSPRQASDVFSHVDEAVQVEIIEAMPRKEVAALLAEMHPDDRADIFKALPENLSEAVMPALAQAEREDVRRLAAHPEGTAGSVMTSDYATLPPQLTVSQAIDHLRQVAPDKETIYYAYVLDGSRRLLGFVSLKDLIVSPRTARIEDIMHRKVIAANVDEDQERAARTIQKYDLIALPVTDNNGMLVGIITYDDAIDIITQEHTEDMEKFMGIAGSHEVSVYLTTNAWGHFRNRVPWVIALAVLGLVSGFIVQNFEGLLVQFTVLAIFLPMLADTGGNTGSQAATLVVRALALGEITAKNVFQILRREFVVAVLLGTLLSGLAFGRVMFFGGGSLLPEHVSLVRVALAVSIALGLQVVSSTLIGALLPLGASKMKWDPALVASPALTTVVDITGLLIYFTTAKLVLGI